MVPMLSAIDEASLSVLTRGLEADLQALLPGLTRRSTSGSESAGKDPDLRARLHWNFVQFLKRLTARRPVLLIFENAQWSDPSSLELIHFLSRQIAATPALVLVTYSTDDPETSPALMKVERSLTSLRQATLRRVDPLTLQDVVALLQRTFGIDHGLAEQHAATLHAHTAGNPFFLEETLKALIGDGRIRCIEQRWSMWDLSELALPTTVRDAVHARLASISDGARRVAEVAAAVGTRTSLELMERVAALDPAPFAEAVDELCARRILIETRTPRSATYEFAHPIVQSAVLDGITSVRRRALHAGIADQMIREHGDRAVQHAADIAIHLAHGSSLGSAERDLRFLAAAGRDALAKRADREAAQWLSEALEIVKLLPDSAVAPAELRSLVEDLATARGRIGEPTEELWTQAHALAEKAGDDVARSRALRQLGLAAVWAGRTSEALQLFSAAESAARAAERLDLAVRVRVTTGMILLSLGRATEGEAALLDILPTAERVGDDALLGRLHRALLQLYGWTGNSSLAREHGSRALAHASASGDKSVAWSAHWAMALLEGFTGNSAGVASHRREAARLADQLRSPVLQAWTAEIAIEYASAVGEWSEGLALAERTIPIARAVAARTLLPRLLVWTGLIVLARDEVERAHDLFQEAWRLSRADKYADVNALPGHDVGNVHNIILAYTGMAAYHLALGEWARAVIFGSRGLDLADRFGYVVWPIHRLLPILAEALLYLQAFDRVEAIGERLRAQSGAMGHRLGLAWATAIDALIMRFKHQSPEAASRLLASAEELEAVPIVFHAARLRRNAAQLLETDGDVEGAIRELRRAHEVFAHLGAEFELRGTRSHLRSLGVRLPPRNVQAGAGTLTGRELEIARCVARRLSNKEIARALEISARTVSTHLSNIFEKLGVDSRGALADLVRESPLLAEPVA
jgi:DNA-binding CsgD family transcriptional regulator